MRVWRYLRLARPHFLVGGALLFAVGARSAAAVDAARYLLGQGMVTAIQLTAQLTNEYGDAEADTAVTNRTLFSGGSGVIPSGVVARRAALVGARITTTVALAAMALMTAISPRTAVIGAIALAVAWTYSTPPVRLLGTGWGELVTSVVVAGLVPLTGAWSQGTSPTASAWWTISALIPLHLAMVLCFELPDLESDALAAKRVLAVRIGRGATHRLISTAAVTGAVLLAAGGLAAGDPLARLGVVAAGVLPAAAVAVGSRRRHWGLTTFGAVGAFVVIVAGLLTGR